MRLQAEKLQSIERLTGIKPEKALKMLNGYNSLRIVPFAERKEALRKLFISHETESHLFESIVRYLNGETYKLVLRRKTWPSQRQPMYK